MKIKTLFVLSIGLGLLLFSMPVLGHHSFMVEYDMSKPFTIKGVITKVEYVNPHISFFVDVTDSTGRVTNWGFEAASPTALRANGWNRDSIKAGEAVTIEAFRARTGVPFAAARTLILSSGRRLSVASDGVPPANKY